MDPLIDPTAKLTEELRAKASASGVLMIVMSNRYLKSSWCKDELEWFRKQVEARPGESGRVFVLRAQKTDTTLWPEFFRDERGNVMTGFSFYDPETGFPWDYPDLNEPNAEFRRNSSGCRPGLSPDCANCANERPKRLGKMRPARQRRKRRVRGSSIFMRSRTAIPSARKSTPR